MSWVDQLEDEYAGRKRGRGTAWKRPGDLAAALDPSTRETRALRLIDDALVDVDEGRCDRLIITMPPQEGKSTRVTKVGALWMLTRNPSRRVVIASHGSDLANEFGRAIRNYVTVNDGTDGTLDLGLRIAPDNGSVASWAIEGHRGGVRSVGLSGGITGRPADVMFIDDPIKNREEAQSERWRQRAKDFWTDVATTRLAPGAPVVIILTRWHEDDLAGWLLTREDADRWRVLNIPAQADHDPEKGQTDVLGREPGEYMDSARVNDRTQQPRSDEEWEQVKVQTGGRSWAALYQGRPAPAEGEILKRHWWKRYGAPQWIDREDGSKVCTHFDEMIASWDMTFKDTAGTDYVAAGIWMRRGADAFLLDVIYQRMDFVETLRQFRAFSARWPQATMKLVEDKANGPAVIAMLNRMIPGIIPEEPAGSKEARAVAISPLIEAGNVWLPTSELAPWSDTVIDQCAAFPNGTHDDIVDMTSQALKRLILLPLGAGEIFTEEDLDEELADFASYLPQI